MYKTMQKQNTLSKFLAVEKWKELYSNYKLNSKIELSNSLENETLLLCLFISFVPILSSAFFTPKIGTIVFGTICVISILLRNKLNFPKINLYKGIKKDLILTHTAFALGCIPAVIVILLSPDILSQHSETITQTFKPKQAEIKLSYFQLSAYILFISIWIAVLEEVVFRGLLLSSLRRSRILAKAKHRDLIAILISAIVFGFAHYHSWGLQAAISTAGLGFGFGVAYISVKEKLIPLIIYHFLFDLLSLSFVLLLK